MVLDRSVGAAAGLILAILAGCGSGDSDTAVSASPATSGVATVPAPTGAADAGTPATAAPPPADAGASDTAATPTVSPPPAATTSPEAATAPSVAWPPAASAVTGRFLAQTFQAGNTLHAPTATGKSGDGSEAWLDLRLYVDPIRCVNGQYSGGDTVRMLVIQVHCGDDAQRFQLASTLTALSTVLPGGTMTLSRDASFAIDRSASYPTNALLAEWRNGSYFVQYMVQTEDSSALLRSCWHVQLPGVFRLACVKHDPDDGEIVRGLYLVDDDEIHGKRTWE